jgi:hypothetical protein
LAHLPLGTCLVTAREALQHSACRSTQEPPPQHATWEATDRASSACCPWSCPTFSWICHHGRARARPAP